MKKISLILLSALAAVGLVLSGCSSSDSGGGKTVAATGVEISGNTMVAVDATITLTATLTPSDATEDVVWSIESGSEYATIGASTGVLTGTAAGSVTVLATVGAVTDTYDITVVAGTAYNIPISYVYGTTTQQGWQTTLDLLSTDAAPAKDDIYLLTMTGVSDTAIVGLQGYLCDTTEAASWWTVLSDSSAYLNLANEATATGDIAANTAFSLSQEITITASQVGTGASAHKLVLFTGTSTTSTPTLYLTTFTLVKKGLSTSIDKSYIHDDSSSTATVTATLVGSTGTISWESSPASGVTLTPSSDSLTCAVTGATAGTYTITATAGTLTSSKSIIVASAFPSALASGTTYSGYLALTDSAAYVNPGFAVASGGTLAATFSVYGASAYKQVAFQTNADAWGWHNVWVGDSGVTDGTAFSSSISLTTAEASSAFQIKFSGSTLVTDGTAATEFYIKDFTLTYTAP